jgi:hypothetical protein
MFALMSSCWELYPRERPTFKTIAEKLKTFGEDGKHAAV